MSINYIEPQEILLEFVTIVFMNSFKKAKQWVRSIILMQWTSSWSFQKKKGLKLGQADNVPVDTSLLIWQFLVKNKTILVPHPPYSPDLAPTDYFFFQYFKSLKGWHFQSINLIQENSLPKLSSVPNKEFQKCFEGQNKCWEWCIRSRGNYFEANKAEWLLR